MATPKAHPPVTESRWRIIAILALFAVSFTSLRVASYIQTSATWDEPIHLTAGYAALAHGDFRVDPSHPPFVRMWAALPLLAMPGVTMNTSTVDHAPAETWLADDQPYRFARAFMYGENDADRMLYAARFMIVLLGVAAGLVLFFWCHEWLGMRAAIFALAFYTVEPNIAAHSQLVTTDFGATALFFATIYFLWRVCRGGGRWSLAGLAICFALAIVTKYSGLILVPIVGALLALAVWRGSVPRRRAFTICLTLVSVTLVTVWAVYGFRNAPSDDPAWRFTLAQGADVQAMAPRLSRLMGWTDATHLLPNAFTQGFLYFAVASENASYLLGDISPTGWWYYFPVAMAVKTPVSLLLLTAIGLIVYLRYRRSLGVVDELFVLLPAAMYLSFAVTSGINIGLRHILPVYPFLLIIAAAAADRLLASRRIATRLVLATLVLRWAWSFVSVYPHSLSFFNLLAGGPERGSKYLSDSNLDWGQDLKRLKQWMNRERVSHINLAYFGQAEPAYYGIDASLLPGTDVGSVSPPKLPGFVAISATVLTGVYFAPAWRLLYQAFDGRTPVAEIGNSIRVYWVDEWPELPVASAAATSDSLAGRELELAAALAGIKWFDHSLAHYERYLDARPADARAWANYGLTSIVGRHADAGIAALRKAVVISPTDAVVRGMLAAGLLETSAPKEALPEIERAVALAPQDPALVDLLGLTLAAVGRMHDALAQFERAAAINPDYAPAREHRSRTRMVLGAAVPPAR
jgi:4-amino-4-deoxy-L-arabinose transferase-like glycosyltransferase